MICPSCRAENPEATEVCFTCRAVLSAVTLGSVVGGRYEVVRLLGRGGMGTVYEARDRVLDEAVAVKVLRSDVAGSPGMAQRFRSEIKLARKVSHGNVCRIYEYGEEGGLQYISMELVDGTNLKERLRLDGRLAPEAAGNVAIQAAEDLEAIHRMGIIHRDLKAANIMLDARGRVRLMDFGIAKTAADASLGGTSGYVLGSPEYMSPEQARGRPVDFRTDLYSLGIVVYEVLTGRVPFRGDSPVSTLLLQIEGEPPLQGPDAGGIPPAFVPVLRKALAKNPEARYAGAGELADAFRAAFAAAFPGRAPATRPAMERTGPAARGRIPWAGAAVFVLVAVAGLGLWQGTRTASRPDPGDSPRAAGPGPLVTPRPSPLESAPTAIVSAPATSSPTRARPAPRRATTPLEPRAGQNGSLAETPAPTPSPTAVAAVDPGPSPVVPVPTPRVEEPGWLLVVVTPWAEVTVDGKPAGQTPLGRIPVGPGAHSVVLSHPDFLPYPRRVTLRAGEAFKLVVNLETDGVRRKR